MADSSKLIMIVGGAAVAYYAYTQGWLSSLGIAAPVAAAATPATTTLIAAPPAAPVNPNPITGSNTLAGIYARMIAAAGPGPYNADVWNTYLATAGSLTPPDPMPIFTAAVPGFTRSQTLTAAQYWGVMAPALTAQQGLSGMGRVFAGLGAIRATMRRG
jgi:hypothetical protein